MTILIDIDGTLTDGKMYIDHKGEKMFKAFHSRDVRAIRELIYNGFQVILVTADDHPSGKYFADKVGAEYICERDKSKLPAAKYVVADDAWDIPMINNALMAFCPADADWSVKALPNVRKLTTPAGDGVVAELTRIILDKNYETSIE